MLMKNACFLHKKALKTQRDMQKYMGKCKKMGIQMIGFMCK